MGKYTISLGDDHPDPTELIVTSGDQVIFKNETGSSATVTIASPGLLNPSNPIPAIPDGQSSQQLTVGNAQGATNYSYTFGQSLGTLSGRIRTN